MSLSRVYRDVVRASWCPGCKARLGQQCLHPTTKAELTVPHRSRVALAEQRFPELGRALAAKLATVEAAKRARPKRYRGGRYKLSAEQVAQISKRLAAGKPAYRVAGHFRVTELTLRRALKRHGLYKPGRRWMQRDALLATA